MGKMKTKILLVLISLAMIACAPMTKERYMERYAEFMDEISQNASSYTENDWVKKDKQYQKYSDELYNKFKKELTASDKLTLAGYKIKYTYYRGLSGTSNWLMDVVNGIDVDAAVSRIKSCTNELVGVACHADKEVSEIDKSLNNLMDKVDTIITHIGRELDRAETELSSH